MDDTRIFRIEPQTVELASITTPGWILDVGGGGEGVIGQLCGSRVVAIDRIQRELVEAPGDALKILMDATDLKFLDETFETATAFFFLMFVPPADHAKVFSEIYRVLRPGGRWLFWDLVVPPYPGGEQDVYVFRITVNLPDGRKIETGYGTLWPDRVQNVDYFTQLATETGFKVIECQQKDQTYHLVFEK